MVTISVLEALSSRLGAELHCSPAICKEGETKSHTSEKTSGAPTSHVLVEPGRPEEAQEKRVAELGAMTPRLGLNWSPLTQIAPCFLVLFLPQLSSTMY